MPKIWMTEIKKVEELILIDYYLKLNNFCKFYNLHSSQPPFPFFITIKTLNLCNFIIN